MARDWSKTYAAGPTERDLLQLEWMLEQFEEAGIDADELTQAEWVMFSVKMHTDYQASAKNQARKGYVPRSVASIAQGGKTTFEARADALEPEPEVIDGEVIDVVEEPVEAEVVEEAPALEAAPVEEAPKPSGRRRNSRSKAAAAA